MRSFKQWMADKWKELNTVDHAAKEKNLKGQINRIANWTFREVVHAMETGLKVDQPKLKRIVKRNTKTWFKEEYEDRYFRMALERTNRMIRIAGPEVVLEQEKEFSQKG